jgi:Uma2 family endonuclease
MAALPKASYTPEEYLALDRAAECKSEYHAGEIFAMAGASEAHNIITGNTLTELHAQLKGRAARLFSSEMRVHISEAGWYVYPDASVVCGERRFADDRRDVLLNPVLIVEVVSPATEFWDRGSKFEAYRRLPSLEQYLLVDQNRLHVERYTRRPEGGWLLADARGLAAVLHLSSIGCDLALADVYDGVSFEPAARVPPPAGGPR